MDKIALIAHDEKKEEMVELVAEYRDRLKKRGLVGTGNTGKLISKKHGLLVETVSSGPLGGDQEIGSMVARGKLGAVIFLRDPLTAQPHEPDITALMRVCDVHSIPLATNISAARMVLDAILRNS